MRLFRGTPDLAPLPFATGSPEELAARWVRWVAEAGITRNPIDDDTGELAGDRQPADVWFLAGTYGGAVTRRCPVPAGRPLFFPVFCMWSSPADGDPPVVEGATATARLDGSALPVVEIGTPVPFDVSGPRFNAITRRRAPGPVQVWGLWCHVAGLAAGPHALQFDGSDGAGFRLSVRYELDAGAR